MDEDLLSPPSLFITADAPIYIQVEYSPGSWNIIPQNKKTGVDIIPPYQLAFSKRQFQTEHPPSEQELYPKKDLPGHMIKHHHKKNLQPAPKVIVDISKLSDQDINELYVIGVVDEQVYRLSEGQRFGILVSGVLNVKCSPENIRGANIHDLVYWNHKRATNNWSTFPEFSTGEIELVKEPTGNAIGRIYNYVNSASYCRIFFEVFYSQDNYRQS